MNLTEKQKLSLDIDEFVEETNARLQALTKRSKELGIELKLSSYFTTKAEFIAITKEYGVDFTDD